MPFCHRRFAVAVSRLASLLQTHLAVTPALNLVEAVLFHQVLNEDPSDNCQICGISFNSLDAGM